MRIAALTDIHGNADALAAVIADLEVQSPDLVVNLGDCLSGPLQAVRTAEMLMERDWPTVRGNHDRWLVAPPEPDGAWEAICRPALSSAHLGWLAGLPATLVAGPAFLCHGTPQSDLTYWLHEPLPPGVMAPRPLARIAAEAEGITQSLILCGHTHLAGAARLPDGRLVVNPGSVGCPGYTDDHPVPHAVNAGTPLACYAVLDETPKGWAVAFRQIPYDPTAVVAQARSAGNADWASALATGWVAAG